MSYFARPGLATELADQLRGQAVFGDAHNGLFLAAPRRTGKSMFLQHDLRPALAERGVLVIYVDLWSDQRRDPGDHIAEAISLALVEHAGVVAKTARKAGLQSITIAGALKIDTSRIGKPDGATLTQALQALHTAAGKPVALIIDEAQHALTSEAGEAAMAALKSARDQMNTPDDVALMLVMSGSDRDKLLRLVNANGAAFFGSTIHQMPTLGKSYVDHVVALIEQQRAEQRPVDHLVLLEAFQLFGYRPQFFHAAIGEALNPLEAGNGERFEQRVLAAARRRRDQDAAQMRSDFLGLKPLERAVLWRMLALGRAFRPYDAEALAFYREQIPGLTVSAQKVQAALENLRDRTPALVWKSARGEYSAHDGAMHAWYQELEQQGMWPPVDGQPLCKS
ncbi:AAA family ATPase [Cupriavidus sp. BIS7]|uniref:AAA family ATPase n=1 Tax=Cupriavidus sp. BIS7 TaxID=1217718 RepID=UPI000312D938|nr:AAA family ATPase [Cupriavidus sp. BIS7]